MESKLSWILNRTAFDVEAFVKAFDHETKKSTLNDIEELTKNKRLSQATRKAIERDLDIWLALDHGTFWQEQKKTVTAKKELSNTQTALIGTAGSLVPGTLDQVSNAFLKEVTSASNAFPIPVVKDSQKIPRHQALSPAIVEEDEAETDDGDENAGEDEAEAVAEEEDEEDDKDKGEEEVEDENEDEEIYLNDQEMSNLQTNIAQA
ncbi:hypothetical protein BGZ46_004707 [Entomortierella lignicola]|nr:hypothetical protein BGZ46_004707 [Entomortierella lignicola]